MWRFYVAAAVIVAAFVFVVSARRLPPPDLRIAAKSTGTPSVPRAQRVGSAAAIPVRGDAPWALSALPDCARQVREERGSPELIRSEIPAGAMPVEGELFAGPCSVRVAAGGIYVTRGEDRLRIPPPAHLFQAGGRYYLYVELGARAELREYTFAR